MNYLFFILFHFAARGLSFGVTRVVAVDDMSCELEELLYQLLLKGKAVSAQRELSSCHRAIRHLVIHILLTLNPSMG